MNKTSILLAVVVYKMILDISAIIYHVISTPVEQLLIRFQFSEHFNFLTFDRKTDLDKQRMVGVFIHVIGYLI